VYKINYSKEATKSLLRMPRNMAKLIRERLEMIAADPYADHPNAKNFKAEKATGLE
jgi:mRNA-degrading endonuclease RelE of RelBE toxin-antitoxin system